MQVFTVAVTRTTLLALFAKRVELLCSQSLSNKKHCVVCTVLLQVRVARFSDHLICSTCTSWVMSKDVSYL